MAKRKVISSVLKQAIRQSGLSLYRISKETEVDPRILSRFMRGQTRLRLDFADTLAEYFGLELTERQVKHGKRK